MKKYNNVRHDTEENWNRAVNFIPPEGELIIYDGQIEGGHYVVEPRFKLGDGVTKIINLPFLSFTGNRNKTQYENGTLIFPEDR